MKVEKYELPDGLYYSNDNSWVKASGGVATIGVTAPAAAMAKEFVFIDLPKVSQKLKKDETTYVSLEAVKWSGHLTSPVSGNVIEVNDALYDSPSAINKDPYGKGWVAKVEMSDPKEINELMDSKAAADWVRNNVLK